MRARLYTVAWVILTLASLGLYLFYTNWLVQNLQNPPEALLRAAELGGVSFELFVVSNALNHIFLYVPFFVTAQLIALRRGRERFPFLTAVSLLAVATVITAPATPQYVEFALNPPLVYALVSSMFLILFSVCLPFFIVSFPDGKLTPRWTIWAALGAALVNFLFFTNQAYLGTVEGILALGVAVIMATAFGALVYAQVWRYRNYLTPVKRQQVKWFVVGAATIPIVFAPWVIFAPVYTFPDFANPAYIPTLSFLLVSALGVILLPISVGFAILRYRLFDIDVIIRRTLTYALVTAMLVIVFFGSVVLLQQAFAAFTDSGSNELITVVSTLAIAALFVPLRNRVQGVIDRRFNRKKYDAQQVLQKFGETVRDETDLERLTGQLVEVVNDTMQPRSVSVWLRPEKRGE